MGVDDDSELPWVAKPVRIGTWYPLALTTPQDPRQIPLYTLSILTMSAECERDFGSVKKLIAPERDAMADDTIEACECLKAWWDQDGNMTSGE